MNAPEMKTIDKAEIQPNGTDRGPISDPDAGRDRTRTFRGRLQRALTEQRAIDERRAIQVPPYGEPVLHAPLDQRSTA